MKSARAAAFRALHPGFRPLGDFIEEATVIVRPADEPEKLWPVYGVNNRVGVVLSHHQPGEEFNAPYKHIERDWFFHNPTRANVGSLGRVPEVPPDALTSPEYQVWRIRHGLLPDFVEILIRLPFFLDLVECHRVGAVKERLFVENLKEIPIPPLSEGEQRGIVERWREAEKPLSLAEASVLDASRELDETLHTFTDFRPLETAMLVLNSRDLSNWDTKSARAAAFRLANPTFVPLGIFAEEATEIIKPWLEPERDWPIYGVDNKEGVFHSHFQPSSEFNMPYKRIRKDWFFHNPTRSSVGSLGIVPDVPEDAITSPEYQVWRLRADSEWEPEFVAALVRTRWFVRLIQVHRVGAVKQRLYVENLLQMPMPKVQKSVRQRVVAQRKAALKQLEAAREALAERTAQIEATLLNS